MLATFKADNPRHREIVKMFVGCEVLNRLIVHSATYVTGVYGIYFQVKSINKEKTETNVVENHELEKITIDLSTAKMDLRLAIGTEIEFIEDGDTFAGRLESIAKDINSDYPTIYLTSDECSLWGVSEKIKLSTDYLKSIGVELEGEGCE
jgi:hypothetical protein